MEGGGMKGMFTCGVIDVLMENDVTFDVSIGVSAGAIFGINVKSKQPRRSLNYTKIYRNDKRYSSLSSLLKTGNYFNAEFCYHTIPDELDVFDRETFKKNPMRFYVVATDCKTGKPAYHLCNDAEGDNVEWIRASASIPIISRPVKIEGGEYVDGGVTDSIPFEFAKRIGCDKRVLILTKEQGYRAKKTKFMPFIKYACKKYPALVDDIKRRRDVYNRQMQEIERLEKTGDIFVIRPSKPLDMTVADKRVEKLQRAYDLGRTVTEESLPALLRYLGKDC